MRPQGGREDLPSFGRETEPDEPRRFVPPLLMRAREEIAGDLLPGDRSPASLREFQGCRSPSFSSCSPHSTNRPPNKGGFRIGVPAGSCPGFRVRHLGPGRVVHQLSREKTPNFSCQQNANEPVHQGPWGIGRYLGGRDRIVSRAPFALPYGSLPESPRRMSRSSGAPSRIRSRPRAWR